MTDPARYRLVVGIYIDTDHSLAANALEWVFLIGFEQRILVRRNAIFDRVSEVSRKFA